MEFTFGIITSNHTSQHLIGIIEQIKVEVPSDKREIIVVGGQNPNIDGVVHIDFNESQKPMWITRKKNLITQHSTKENIVYLHDYIGLAPGWYEGQLRKGNDFSIRMDKIINFDGSRFRDWSIWPHNGNEMDSIVGHECLLPYHIGELSKFMYISGTYWIAKRNVMLKYPLNEELAWGQGEDVEWSKIVRQEYDFQMNTHSAVQILKPGKDRAFKEMCSETFKRVLAYANLDVKKNKFLIITPSYNNEEWIEYNLASILNQTYTNYEVVYIDDASTDSTYERAKEIVGELPNWNVIKNSENRGAMYNYFHNLSSYVKDPEQIVIHLDGDDWLYDETVLEKLNAFYNEKDCWMTYGGFVVWNGPDEEPTLPHPQSTEHSEFVHKHKLYRQDLWRASHLRTYRAFLLQAVKLEDLRSLEDGEYYWHASDLAFQYPCMEMCPKDKIQVVDFYDCVYNHSKGNGVRTRERESIDNSRYELEIRGRKKYSEGLQGQKLPQVNVLGNFRESNSIPKTFSYVYNLVDGEFDITLIEDMEILRFVKGEVKVNRGLVVADVHEAPHLLSQNAVYTAVKQNSEMFDLILTYDKELLKLPNAVFRNGGYEVVLNKNVHKAQHPLLQDDSLIQIYKDKSKHVSFITSNKLMTEGHKFRVGCAQKIINLNLSGVDLYGVGVREIQGKIEGLKNYKFSIAIENGVHDNYFTEKILDCFLTGTIPIYRGCPNIGELFNPKGFLIFNTEEELLELLNNLTEEDYYCREKYIKENFEKARQYAYNNDQLFEKYFKNLINT